MNKFVSPSLISGASLSRRSFLKTTGQSAVVLAVGVNLPLRARGADAEATKEPPLDANAWLTINSDNTVTIISSAAEMGQGSFTSLPMMVAEEMELSQEQVLIKHAPADREFRNRGIGMQVTGGSYSVRWSYYPMRQLGADMRELLKMVAARDWSVDVATLKAEKGQITGPSGQKASYVQLAANVGDLQIPEGTPLKPRSEWKILGTDFARKDTPPKVMGDAEFGVDVQIEGMLIATIKACPHFGGKLASVDTAPALAVTGVEKVAQLSDAVAVCAKDYWAAKKGLDALVPQWDISASKQMDTESIRQLMEEELKSPGIEGMAEGDITAVSKAADSAHTARYHAPYLAHACMEPMNATADVREDSALIIAPTQGAGLVQMGVAQALKMQMPKIEVRNTFLGGGFGRRANDFAIQAALISQQIKAPVKLIWSREEDMAHDFYRPMTTIDFSAHLDNKGHAKGLHIRAATPSIYRARMNPNAPTDDTITEGLVDTDYQFDAALMDYHMTDAGIPVGFWRSVGYSQNSWAIESFVDELAELEGMDPVEWRLQRLRNDMKTGVMERLAEESNWGKPEFGYSQGVALAHSYGSTAGQVFEVKVSDDGLVEIGKITCVIDCGVAINPDSVAAQMEGSIVYGLTAAMYGEINIKQGAAVESNFPQYDMMRLRHMPPVETHIIESTGEPGGVGEPGLPPAAPAMCNAIYAATGRRIRTLPLRKQGFRFS